MTSATIDILLTAIVGFLLVDQHNRNLFRRLDRLDDTSIRQTKEFETTLPAYKEDPNVQALEAGRRSALKDR